MLPDTGLRDPHSPSVARRLARDAYLSVHRLSQCAEDVQQSGASTIHAASFQDRTKNVLRPAMLDDLLGQAKLKALLRRVIAAAKAREDPLDHVLLAGPSGTGKSTVANVIANELGATTFQVEAPVSFDTLMSLREVMGGGDILFIDEIHQQAIMERRGKSSSTQPEVLFSIMEDRTIATPHGVLPFPEITIIGATTDEGMLPDPFVNRFPLRPIIEPYDAEDLQAIARMNAEKLALWLRDDAAVIFASASRGIPRQINNYVRNAAMLAPPEHRVVDLDLAREVIVELNNTTVDGLTHDMQEVLRFLLTRCRRETRSGEVSYQAGVGTLATAIGKSRDQKVIALRVEPYLIQQGYLQVGHGGRSLTELGVARAEELLREEG